MLTHGSLATPSPAPLAHVAAQIDLRKPTSRYGYEFGWRFLRHPPGAASAPEHAFSSSLIGPLPFDLVWVLHLDPKRTWPLRFENIMFSYPTRSGVNVLEDFNLEVKVGENVAVVVRHFWNLEN
jgi:ABC-type multidrug transport system fused ATPase/permease subunit